MRITRSSSKSSKSYISIFINTNDLSLFVVYILEKVCFDGQYTYLSFAEGFVDVFLALFRKFCDKAIDSYFYQLQVCFSIWFGLQRYLGLVISHRPVKNNVFVTAAKLFYGRSSVLFGYSNSYHVLDFLVVQKLLIHRLNLIEKVNYWEVKAFFTKNIHNMMRKWLDIYRETLLFTFLFSVQVILLKNTGKFIYEKTVDLIFFFLV